MHSSFLCLVCVQTVSFLSSVVAVFSDRLMLCPAAAKIAFCNGCVRSYTIAHAMMLTSCVPIVFRNNFIGDGSKLVYCFLSCLPSIVTLYFSMDSFHFCQRICSYM